MKKIAKIGIVSSIIGTGAAVVYFAVKKSFRYGYEKGRLEEVKSSVSNLDNAIKTMTSIAATCDALRYNYDSLDEDYENLECKVNELEKCCHELMKMPVKRTKAIPHNCKNTEKVI